MSILWDPDLIQKFCQAHRFKVFIADGPDRLCVRIAGVGAKGNVSGIHTEIIPLQLHEIMRSTCLSSSESISGTHSEFF